MNICIIGSLPKPYGGVSTHCYYLTKELINLGNEVLFLDTKPNKDKKIPEGPQYFAFHQHNIFNLFIYFLIKPVLWKFLFQLIGTLGLSRVKNIQFALSLILSLGKISEKRNIDVIHSHHASIRSLGGFLFSLHHCIPFVITAHGAEVTLEKNWQKEKRLISYLLKKNTHIVTVSNFTGDMLKKRGFQGKLSVIPNGIDTSEFEMDEKEVITIGNRYQVPEDKKRILYLSSFKDWKGPDVFLKSLALLDQPFHGIMIGNDLGYLETCKSLAKELDIADKVNLYTDLPFKDIVAFYRLADVFVFPTKLPSEGFGIVALEAMASNTPVIASRIAAIPEVVRDGFTGLLFEPGNSNELANKINQLLSDTGLYRKLQENGIREIRSSYNWQTIAEQTLNVYQKIK